MKLRLKVPLEDNEMPGCPHPKDQYWNRDTHLHSHTNPATQLAHSCWLPHLTSSTVSQAAHIQIQACYFSPIPAQYNKEFS